MPPFFITNNGDIKMNFENTVMPKQKRVDEDRKLRSEAINRYLFKDNSGIKMLKSRLSISITFNVICLVVAAYSLVQGW